MPLNVVKKSWLYSTWCSARIAWLRIAEAKWDNISASGWWRLRTAAECRWWDQQRAGLAADTNLTRVPIYLPTSGISNSQTLKHLQPKWDFRWVVPQLGSLSRQFPLFRNGIIGALKLTFGIDSDLINVNFRQNSDITLISYNTEITFC